MKYLFPSFHFHYVCVLRSQLDLLLTHMQFCFVFIQLVCLLVGTFNPFTFKVITDKYDHVAIYFIVWGSSLYTLSVFPV